MAIIYRSVKGSNLTPTEVDGNFSTAETRLAALEALGVGKSIDYIDLTGNVMTVHYTDHTTDTIIMPTSPILGMGDWQATTSYAVNNTVQYNGTVYIVQVAHISASSFDPGATDGSGHDLYGELFSVPASIMPTNGPTGYALEKISDDDYDVDWRVKLLSTLFDVELTSPLDDGQALVYSTFLTKWTNASPSIANFEPVTNEFVVGYHAGTFLTAPVDFTNITGAAMNDQLYEFTIDVDNSAAGVVDANDNSGVRMVYLNENVTSIIISDPEWFNPTFIWRKKVFVFRQTGSFTVAGWGHIGVFWDGGGSEPTMPSGAGKTLVVEVSTFDAGGTNNARVLYSD